MTPRLCNIVLRKAYIHNMINHGTSDATLARFWNDMAQELFRNVKELYEQIQIQYGDRAPDEGPGAQMAVRIIRLLALRAVLTDGRLSVYIHVASWHAICANIPSVGSTLLASDGKEIC